MEALGGRIMKTRIVQIGNAQGIRIPKQLLEQSGLQGEVEILIEGEALVIRSLKKPRAGWAEAFRDMARRGNDKLLDPETPSLTSWDEEEWEW
jgi:antitoxin MazE